MILRYDIYLVLTELERIGNKQLLVSDTLDFNSVTWCRTLKHMVQFRVRFFLSRLISPVHVNACVQELSCVKNYIFVLIGYSKMERLIATTHVKHSFTPRKSS